MTALAAVPLAILAATVTWTTGAAGMLYLLSWLAVCAPGVPLGMRAFGRGGTGMVAGAAAGYAVTSLAWWAVIAAHVPSRPAFACAWLFGAAVLLALARAWRTPAVTLPQWTRRDTIAISVVLLLVPGLMGLPYRNLGRTDAEGRRYYRAYFTADFVWHVALTAEMARFEMPPRNPYMADRALHYYWTYFLVPATISAHGPRPVRDVQAALKANALATAVLLLGSLYCFAAAATRRRDAAVLGVLLVVLASSAEGFAAMYDLLSRGRSLLALRDINVDAVTAWWYDGLRIDGVHRTMFYTPQHGLSCAFGLLAVTVAAAGGAAVPLRAAVLAGLLLGAATLLNPFLGMAFCVIYGLAIVADAMVRHRAIRVVLPHVLAAVPPVCAAAWGVYNAMSDGAGEALTIGWVGHARRAPVATLMLSLGPVLVPALAGFLPDRRVAAQPARTAGVGLVVGLFLFYLVMLSDQFWVGFRAGQILLVMMTVPLARLFDWLLDARRTVTAGLAATAILAVGLPTTAVDVYNAADITNVRRGAGFRWTVTLSAAEQQALAWVTRATSPLAIVQAEPIVRGRDQWSLVPSFAQRRMAAGLPISLLPAPDYVARSERVRAIFSAQSTGDAHAIARELAIDYLWVDGTDRAAYPGGVARLAEDPTLFTPVFLNDEVTVYAVR
jgi:hypothetical protein